MTLMVITVAILAVLVGVALLVRSWRSRSTTTLTVSSAAKFTKGDTISVGDEYAVITKIEGDVLTVRRR